jgi:branched-chain amino acid transport system substrate-binding protein
VAALAVATRLLGCSEDRSGGGSARGGDAAGDSTSTTTATGAACAADLLACARGTTIADLVPDRPTAAAGEPLVLGMVNQENTPFGSFPELSAAARAAAAFVNDQLGGIGGRPIEIDVCNTEFSPEGSTACAQRFVQAGVPAVLGGIDVFGNAVDVLADNGIPYVGGIPVSTSSVTAATSFQWSGGTWGAAIAFADHAAEEVGAQRVAIVYGDFGPIADGARYGEETLQRLGVDDVVLVPYPITATDLSSPIQAALASDPDALVFLVADTGCAAAFDAVAAAGVDVPAYYTGACAATRILDAEGPEKTDGAIFNVEGPVDPEHPDPDTELYTAVVEHYEPDLEPAGAGTVTFRSFMNLYSVLAGLADADDDADLTPAAIVDAIRGQVDTPSFMGHDYTCDGAQLAGLPALCSPQQILVRAEGGQLTQITDWLDVGTIFGD